MVGMDSKGTVELVSNPRLATNISLILKHNLNERRIAEDPLESAARHRTSHVLGAEVAHIICVESKCAPLRANPPASYI
jgi:hypothetical protein